MPKLTLYDYEGKEKTFDNISDFYNFYSKYCSCGSSYSKRKLLDTNCNA